MPHRNTAGVPTVAVITDNDFNKVSGVTTTLKALIRHAPADLRVRVYTAADVETDTPGYLAMGARGIGLPRYPQMRLYWPHIQRLRQRLDADDVGLVHLTTPGPVGLAARWLQRRRPRPLVGSYHTHLGDYVTAYSGSHSLGRCFEAYMRWFYTPCRSVLVPSESTRDLLVSRGYRADQLGIWSRGVDTTCFTPAAASAELRRSWNADGRLAIVYAGRLAPEKGLLLFGPLQATLAQRDVPFRFVFLGEGPMRAQLETLCPDAVFAGCVSSPQVAASMATADAFLFPSATDSLGNVVVEAQASGCPVLVTDKGGPREQLRHGETGWICPAGDVNAFADRLAEWWHRPELRRRMAEAAAVYAAPRGWRQSFEPLFQSWRAAMAASTPAARRTA